MSDKGKCVPPSDLRGRSATASVLSLDARGPQERYINDDNFSQFTPSFTESPSNAIYQRRTQLGQPSTQYFGNTVKHVFKTKEMGDMLGNMYLKTRLPILSQDQAASNVNIQLPGDFDINIPVGETVCFENSELKALNFGGSNIRYESLIGTSNNQLIANTQYLGYESNVSNIAIGFAEISGHTMGTKLIDERYLTIADDLGNATVNVTITTSEVNVQNPETIDGGIRNFELRDIQRPLISDNAFSYSNVHLLTLGGANVNVNLSGVSNLLPFGTTPGSNYTNNVIAITSVSSNIGSKFIFSNVNLSVNTLDFLTNVTRTSSATSLPLTSLSVGSNVMLSNIVVDAGQSIPDGANILSVGDDLSAIYHESGDFKEGFGGANVVTATSGLCNSNVIITRTSDTMKSYYNINDFGFARAHLYQIDYNTIPGSNTVVSISDAEPRSDTINFYSNTANYVTPAGLSNIGKNIEVVTPPGMSFYEVYLGNVSVDPSDYVLDGSLQPMIEITSPSRNTKITLGFRQQGTNTFLTTLTNYQQILPVAVNQTSSTEIRPFEGYNDPSSNSTVTEVHNRFTVSTGKIDDFTEGSGIYTAYRAHIPIPDLTQSRISPGSNIIPYSGTGEGLAMDPDFLDAMMNGGLIITKLSDALSNVSVRVSQATLDMYVGTSIPQQICEMHSNITTISYNLNNDITITNDTNVYTTNMVTDLGLSAAQATRILESDATHLTLTSNLYENQIQPGASIGLQYGNIFTTSASYQPNSFTKSSNGYANVITNGVSYGPIPIQDKVLNIEFFSNVEEGYSNVVYIHNDYYSNTIERPAMNLDTMIDIIDPQNVNISSAITGNIYTQTVDNFLEIDGVTDINTEDLGPQGYDVFWDMRWPGANIITAKTLSNSISNVLQSDFSDITSLTMDVQSYGEPRVQFTATSEQETVEGWPLSLVSLTLSTGKRFPITYETSNSYYQKAEIFMPAEFNNAASFDYFLDLGDDRTFYSGPLTPNVNTQFLNTFTGNTFYSTDVNYTTSGANVYLNSDVVANVSAPTWNPGVTINFESYSNTLTISSASEEDVFTIPDDAASGYSDLLRNGQISLNNEYDIGSRNTIQDPSLTRKFSNIAFAGYDSNIFFVGGLSGSNLLSTSFKNDVSSGVVFTTISMPTFDFPFRDGRMTLDKDNNNMFLFGVIDEDSNVIRNTSLYKSVINTSDHILKPWTLESTAFPGEPVEFPSVGYVNNKVVVVGGKYMGTDNANHSEIYTYDTSALSWSTITLPSAIDSYGVNGKNTAGSNIYFYTSNTTISYVDASNNFSLHDVTNSPSLTSNVMESPFLNLEATQDESKIFIIGAGKADSNVQYIDTSTQQRGVDSNLAPATPLDENLVGFASYQPYNTPYVVVYGGNNNGVQTSAIFTLNINTYIWTDLGVNVLLENPLYDATFVGTDTPGELPIIRSGVYLGTKKTPILTITDQSTSNVLEVGLKRSNIFTAVSNSSVENKGLISSWYMNTKDNTGRQINVGWDGKDYDGNFAQAVDGSAGPVWLGDALNIETTANFYSSNVLFNSTSNLQNNFLTVNTSTYTGDTFPRANVVTTNVFTFGVGYSNIESMGNLLDFSVNGIVPFTSSIASNICITNNLNPFQPGVFIQNPTTTATISTDNIPYQTWFFDESGGVVTPPGNPPVTSNVMVNDAYRQFLPSRLRRNGRLDKLECFYGASRYTRPSSNIQYDNTLEFGLYRDEGMRARKLTLSSFAPDGEEMNSNAQIEVYKYFASNVGYSSSVNTTERGWYDEIILSFGSDITQSGEFERVAINPGYGTDAVSPTAITNALQQNDTIEVLFDNYNSSDLSVTANVVYRSSAVNRTVASGDNVIKLKPKMFNAISDEIGRSGDVIITTTYNNGLVDSNVSTGIRPISGITVPEANFSSNLLRCCLSSFVKNDPLSPSGYSNTFVQENAFESVFPVNISMNKYIPTGIYTDKIGRAILDEVSIEIGGQEIEKLDDLWYVTRDELFRTNDEKRALKYLINGGQDYLPSSPFNFGPIDLYVPLDFFFCRTRKTSSTHNVPTKTSDEYRSQAPYLPLCALPDQEITVVIKFKPQEYFSNVTTPIDLSYKDTFLVTDEALISPEERYYYMNTPQNLMIEQVKRLPRQVFNIGNDLRYEGLVSDMPMKMMTWLFRSTQFEDENNSEEFLHRYNFSTIRSTNEQYKLFYELLKRANLYLDGVPLVERYGTSDFYKYYQGLNCDLSATDKNIYTYSFSIYPTKQDPSGSINLSNSTSNKTFISFDLELKDASAALEQVDETQGFSIHAYSFGYGTLNISEGRASLAFS